MTDPTQQLKSPWPWWLSSPGGGLRYKTYARAYALATALRLTLPDAMQASWLAPVSLHWLGVLLLLANGCLAGWIACAVGALLPILLLQDQLTQSGYLLACALAACACFVGDRKGDRLDAALPVAVRFVTLAVYGLAALHKLNRDFFDPAFSCANGGLRVLARSAEWIPSAVHDLAAAPGWPLLFVTVEMGLVLLLLVRPAIGVTAACAVHVPLTMIFAPGFAFTMMSGWVCFFRQSELRALARTLRRRAPTILLGGANPAVGGRLLLFPGRWQSDPDWCIKEALLWLVLAWLLETVTTRWRGGLFVGRGVWLEGGPRGIAATVVTLFVLNGLTPYLGLQFHRTGAMLSNLRIDAGCHNSLLFPESLRGHDPYVRVEHIEFAAGRAEPNVSALVGARLWSPEALYRARQRWCARHPEALPVLLRFHDEELEVGNLCVEWPLDRPWLGGMRRFQSNLTRACPQRCVH